MIHRQTPKSSLRCLCQTSPNPSRRFTVGTIRTPDLDSAKITHSRLIKSNSSIDPYTWNTILTAYSRHGPTWDALQLFEEMPVRDTVSWNATIAGHASRGDNASALALLVRMVRTGFAPDQHTLGSALKAAAGAGRVVHGRQVHALALKTGLAHAVFSGSALVDMYAKCGSIGDSASAFEALRARNRVSWNAMIAGHARSGDRAAVFRIFDRMGREGIGPDEATFAGLLALLDDPAVYKLTTQVHAKFVKHGLASDATACNATIASYSECGSIDDSMKVFAEMDDGIRDRVTYNSVLAAYAYHCDGDRAIEVFVGMRKLGLEQDAYAYTSVISACAQMEQLKQGRSLHGLVIKRGFENTTTVSNALVTMYAKSDIVNDAMTCFERMVSKDSYSWNAILTGLSQCGLSEAALRIFSQMRAAGLEIDPYSLSTALRSCSDLAVLRSGRQIHALAVLTGFRDSDYVSSSLIFMYSKCGLIDDAKALFDESRKVSPVAWNSIIFAYAQHGQGHAALELFARMRERGLRPNHVTFIAVITACSHIGLVNEGSRYLESMERDYGVPARMEHYACGVDLYGRAGRLEEAEALIESMPFEADAMVLVTLLGACRMHGEIEMAMRVGQRMMEMDAGEHATYVLLGEVYAQCGRWGERKAVRRAMRERGVAKVPGWSWFEAHEGVHAFNAEDRSHPRMAEVYRMAAELTAEAGVPDCVDGDVEVYSLD
ncbi:putative pentatricopeptide repeat-containing protein [Acorus gramineus]|uniref:Pentatricopeptide repeat-containing protein n=1 Tax=Acorus gramineus TaxID=55184 RepID=A0AAV9AVH8_ACOGR|nr:putative pentatricopeptide repeat-containing protein [Acorus gramineus]